MNAKSWELWFLFVSSLTIAMSPHWLWDMMENAQSQGLDARDHFSDSYQASRARFRSLASRSGAETHRIYLPSWELHDLSIEIAVFRGSPTSVLIHVAGTHGVEGFAGGGIQAALLEQFSTSAPNASTSPTIVLIHALNPYGFAYLRRANEHNIDLNRNFLNTSEFTRRIQQDPNAYGYMDSNDVFNPSNVGGLVNGFFGRALIHMLSTGSNNLKRAAVCGNYHFPKGIFYGGTEQQPSLQLVVEFLRRRVNMSSIKQFGLIDVHTGLGPKGYGTIIVPTLQDKEVAQQVFHITDDPNRIGVVGEESNSVSKEYDGVTGYLCHGFKVLLPPTVQMLCYAQEFGTVSSAFVFKSLVEENAMFHHAPSERLKYAERLRDVFYLHDDPAWKRDVITQGTQRFHQLRQFMASMMA